MASTRDRVRPRPVQVVRDDSFDAPASIAVCPFIANPVDVPRPRIPIEPSAANGLDRTSSLMIEEIATVPKTNLNQLLGRLPDEEMLKLNRSVTVFLGIAGQDGASPSRTGSYPE
jgi:mRNA interferase MazF